MERLRQIIEQMEIRAEEFTRPAELIDTVARTFDAPWLRSASWVFGLAERLIEQEGRS